MSQQLFAITPVPPPVIRLEYVTHGTIVRTYQGYIQEFDVSPLLYVQGKVRVSNEEKKQQSMFQAGEEMELSDVCKVLWWSKERALFCIYLGEHAVCVEPPNADVWENITIQYNEPQSREQTEPAIFRNRAM